MNFIIEKERNEKSSLFLWKMRKNAEKIKKKRVKTVKKYANILKR
jgi:hypothetical protein